MLIRQMIIKKLFLYEAQSKGNPHCTFYVCRRIISVIGIIIVYVAVMKACCKSLLMLCMFIQQSFLCLLLTSANSQQRLRKRVGGKSKAITCHINLHDATRKRHLNINFQEYILSAPQPAIFHNLEFYFSHYFFSLSFQRQQQLKL